MNISKRLAWTLGLTLLATGCGGGGGGGTTPGGNDNSTVTLSALVVGIEIPSEISAVPADNSDQSNKASFKAGSFGAAIRSLLSAVATSELSTTSDYAKAEPAVYVEERALEQFEIIEKIFAALSQTNYAKEENINQGPYKAMISWIEEQNGRDVKSLQTWTVESQMIVKTVPSDVTGNTTNDVNRLLAWIPETDRETGQEELIKAEFLIYTAPDKSADGSLINYGEWDMNVLMGASTTGVDTIPSGGPGNFFAASARIAANGVSVLKVHDSFEESLQMGAPGDGTTMALKDEMRGILYRSGTSGYGQVSYPDWDACWQWDGQGTFPCANGVPKNLSKYAYNSNYLGVQEILDDVSGTPVYKDRNINGAIRLVHRYALFHADAAANIAEGDNIEKHVNFGFPVSFPQTATENGSVTFDDFGFYGAWQGRHQLWVGGSYTPTTDGSNGTTFTRQDVAPGQSAPTYKLKEFSGTFTKRALIDASLEDIRDVAVETFLNESYDMIYFDPDGDGTVSADWQYCTGYIDWSTFNPQTTPPSLPGCNDKENDSPIAFVTLHGTDGALGGDDDSELLPKLSVGDSERRNVGIGKCDETGCTDYLYLSADPSGIIWSGAGFYPAEWGMDGQNVVSGSSIFVPSIGDQLWVNMSGSIYIAYTGDFTNSGTGWVQKTLLTFDEQNWTPTFDPSGDTPFSPERGFQYYMNASGQNYVVTRTDAGSDPAAFESDDYSAKLELQTAANPANTNSASSVSVLPTGVAYLASPWDKQIKFTLVEDPSNTNYLMLVVLHDSSGNSAAGSVATSGAWGLVAFADGSGDNDYTAGKGFDNDAPIASDGTTLVVDAYGWVDPALNSGMEPIQFNWEYADQQNPWGKQQFLQYASNAPTGSSIGDYIILSDPISLTQVGLYNNLGNPVMSDSAGAAVTVGGDESNWKKVSLQFDGWLQGMPDLYNDLQNNSWVFTSEMASKVRRLKEGQMVTDGTKNYFVKPMDTSLFLGVVTEFDATPGQPDISAADNVNLTTVPDYVHHEMDAAPTTGSNGSAIEVKYSEGLPI